VTFPTPRLREFLALGTGPLHDAGVLLSVTVLLAGGLALILRARAFARGRRSTASIPIYRMISVLGALGGCAAYLCEPGSIHSSRDLALGGLAALPWMLTAGVEMLGKRRGR
jgi:hypothetical protein